MQVGRTILRTLAPLGLAAFIAAGCGGPDGVLGFGGIPEDAVCTVAGTPIRKSEYNRMFDNAEQQYKDNGRDFPKKDSEEYKGLRSDLVEYLVQQALIQNEAKKFDLSASSKEIEAGVDELKERVAQGDEKKFKEEMKRVNYSLDLVKKDVKFDVISKKLYAKVVSDIKVSDEDAKEYFKENAEQFKDQEAREVAHILVKKKAKADEIYAKVKGGDKAEFAKQAKANTIDPSSKDTGGVLPGGEVQRGQTVPEFDKVAFDLKTGEVSEPIKTSYGWHIISARSDVKPERTKKFSEVKDDIKTQMKGEQEGERYQEWTTDIREDAESNVRCRDGFVWKQTVTETETAPAPAPEETDAPDESADDAADGDDAKDDKADKADAKTDDKKADAKKSDKDAKAKDE